MAKNFISEDDIEQIILSKLSKTNFGYQIIKCDPSPEAKERLEDGTGRTSKKQCILPNILKDALYKLNPKIDKDIIDNEIAKLEVESIDMDLPTANYKVYKKIRDYKQVTLKRNNKDDFDFIKLIDFDHPENNVFTAVSQMWICGRYKYRRPDILIFINGLPIVFIELKNSIVKLEEAYNNNLKSYIEDIPNLFIFNQICVLSNGMETKMGSFSASYDDFFEWFKSSEKQKIDKKQIYSSGVSIDYLIDCLFKKEILIDYIENFILFENVTKKIIAKNHQYLGVNNLINSFKQRKANRGKLGVFWHTQGSGKSYSMVMFTRKVNRKIKGNYTFLIVTDREDLDTQIHKNFIRTETIKPSEETQPKDSKQLREFLGKNKQYIFTLIQKFRYDKTKKFPILSERNDIIVLVDEAHRTQYKDLAENMRTGLPKANFIAFTGTPLLGSKRLTNQWFGDYVSEYNFAQSINDGSTVPLFYTMRVPEVALQNNFLDDDILDVIENENLNEDEIKSLENSSSKILEVIKRKPRLEKIAKDIAHHFPTRGFLGKGMVISVDKFTAVRMYDLVKHYWNIEIQNLIQKRNTASSIDERRQITKQIEYMQNVEMAVVISEEVDEEKKFANEGLDILSHKKRMKFIDAEGRDIEDQFKDPNNKLQLVFVCSMWLTGFDVKNLSTLYLDKPMKSHTLMQAIARANRVYPGKTCGVIVDYVNVFKYMKQALSDYAISDDDSVMPVKNIEQLITNLDKSISETDKYLKSIDIDLDSIIQKSDTLGKLEALRQAYNKITDKIITKDKFKVLSNTMVNLYEASKPEIFERGWTNIKFSPIKYIRDLFFNLVNDQKINNAKLQVQKILDSSISSAELINNENYVIKNEKVIDLSKINLDDLHKRISKSPYKSVEVENLKSFIEETLKSMIDKNVTRIKFSERYKQIIERYNSGETKSEKYYNDLVQLIGELKTEQNRSSILGLSEEELEIYDLLVKDKKLSNDDLESVKKASKNLYLKLIGEENDILVVDWYKDNRTLIKVKSAISDSLDEDLPKSYDKKTFENKTNILLSLFVDKAIQGLLWN